MLNLIYLVWIVLHFYLSYKKDENEGLKTSRQEIMHKLNELAAHCKEVERQRDEEAENCRLLEVPIHILL